MYIYVLFENQKLIFKEYFYDLSLFLPVCWDNLLLARFRSSIRNIMPHKTLKYLKNTFDHLFMPLNQEASIGLLSDAISE